MTPALSVLASLALGTASPATPAAASPLRAPVAACRAWIEGRSWALHTSAPQTLIISPGAACHDGVVEPDGLKVLHDWIDAADMKGAARPILVVRSGGGDAETAIALAEKLQAKDAELFAVDTCASSCANYFYAGVRRRHVVGPALLLFHGGFSAPSRERSMAALDELLSGPQGASIADHKMARQSALAGFNANLARQDRLYRAAGTDPRVVHGVDALDFAGIGEANCGGPSDLSRNFVFFDHEQMARLNILPLSGQPETRPQAINAAIAQRDGGFIACLAPDDFARD